MHSPWSHNSAQTLYNLMGTHQSLTDAQNITVNCNNIMLIVTQTHNNIHILLLLCLFRATYMYNNYYYSRELTVMLAEEAVIHSPIMCSV